MTNRHDLELAISLGVDAVGFILYPKSPRYIEPERASELATLLPPFIQRVAVTVKMPKEQVSQLAETGTFDIWQFHGNEPPEYFSSFPHLRKVKALGLPLPDPKTFAPASFHADAFLLDKASSHYGGTGKTFDWNLATQFQSTTPKPCILAGGLNPENVSEAIQSVRPYAVDVCSGVEQKPGLKDASKMRDFVQSCRQN